ncbi:shikimate kinase [Sulfuriflexus mobilis]|uniref:shikimate kinase n=1 Tax=Sulfuriflexus mobilis TaxID=1811807 RepID=UPI0018D4F2CF|nr:shikimate kinase [Sulfuriflexus mobilis]
MIIFGNSGAGKTTLAKALGEEFNLAHLDLDTLAWRSTAPPERRAIAESAIEFEKFLSAHTAWVIEGCYADLIELATPHATEIIFLNPGIEACINHCKNRPWEPHKYKSKAEQDANLDMLITWVKQYDTRDDEFSLTAHKKIFTSFHGKKTELGAPVSNTQA